MNKLLYLLILCLLLVVLKAALIVLALAVIGLFLWAVITKPKTVLAFTGTLILAFLITTHPAFWSVVLAIMALAILFSRRSKPTPPALPAPD